jgi:hypothetical protein
MFFIPQVLAPVIAIFSSHFSRRTHSRFAALIVAAVLTSGSRTVANLVRTLGRLASGHLASYCHVFSARTWSPWRLARALAVFVVARLAPTGTLHLAADDTVLPHGGDHVFGKGRHRDAVRSSHTYTVFHYGHKWVVLCLLVDLPFAKRRWALPVAVALYTAPKQSKQTKNPRKCRRRGDARRQKKLTRHKTQPELLQGLLARFMRWFPDRHFSVCVDGGFSTHRLAGFASRSKGRLVLVGRFYANAALHEAPIPHPPGHAGRPKLRGRRLPSPCNVVAAGDLKIADVVWYAGAKRRVGLSTGCGLWYRHAQGLVPVRWVFVRDLEGNHRDEYFFTTDQSLTPEKIVGVYVGRWNVETTFQEVRAHLHIGSTKCWSRSSVLREIPCLFGLYTLIAVAFATMPGRHPSIGTISWQGKATITFSDALSCLRRRIWREWISRWLPATGPVEKLPAAIQEILLTSLAPAA